MKTIFTTLPEMYAGWMAIGWSMLLGKPQTGPAMEPHRSAAQAADERGRADKNVSAKPAKMAQAKPAAKKSPAKPARRAAPAKKRRASGKRR